MGSMNQAILIGHLGRDVEVRFTQGGTAVGTVNLATTESWTDKASGQKKEQTEWHRVILWGKTAENLQQYLLKGKQIAVVGKLQTRKWTDKNGVERYTTEIRADRVVLLGSASGNSGGQRRDRHVGDEEAGTDRQAAQPVAEFDDSDIPF